MHQCFLIAVLACLCTAGLSAEPASSDVEAVAQACNQFSFDLLGQVQKPGENVFFSSYSICTALAMVLLGAGGNTAKQLRDTFHYDASLDVNSVYQKLIAAYNDANNSKYTLSTANRLYGANNFKLNETYEDNVKKFFLANLQQLDFGTGTAEGEINQWVAQQTHDKIQNLFPQGSLTPSTQLVLANAIYFKGNWVKQFRTTLTKKEPFTGYSGKNELVDMMNIQENFPYQQDEQLNAKVLEMPYSGDRLSMIIILPNEIDGLSEVIKKLNAGTMRMLMNAPPRKVDVKLPKFKLETEYELVSAFQNLNLTDLFTGADLSGISSVPLRVSQVRHKAFVQVDEEGTEAAAATGVAAVFMSSIILSEVPPQFYADHPFYFAVVDKTSRFILFSGVVINPKK